MRNGRRRNAVPFEEPEGEELAQRLPAVLDVVYLIFNEGYLASAGEQLTRPPLATEAHRLAQLLTELLPAEPEAWALRALIAFHRSREDLRLDSGSLVTLEDQDRSRWDQVLIGEGQRCLAKAGCGPLGIQARLAGCHATAPSFAATDWTGIVACYDELLECEPNAVVALHRAVAIAMAHGPAAALPLLDALVADPALARSHRVWSVRADLLRRRASRKCRRRLRPRARAGRQRRGAAVPGRRPSTHRGALMPDAESTITIERPIQDVFAYLADGTNNPRWRPGVLSIERTSPTPAPARPTGRSCAAQAAAPSTATTRSPPTSRRPLSNSGSPPARPGRPGASPSPKPARGAPRSRSRSDYSQQGSCA